ncbi:MAG TPA: PDR/VanB family oxidoreductase [Nevskiales bacterium]|nr:PDR/VanB family oxidoreductase [Nevskiales bacterium]
MNDTLSVLVADVEQLTPLIKLFTLVPVGGGRLPGFSGGSHIVVTMEDRGKRHRNPYSLLSSPEDTRYYQIAVRRDDAGRGGSRFMHERVAPGTVLAISTPFNLFPLNRLARKHILIAGGIGITPFLAQLADLRRNGAEYELHYAYRSPEHAAFRDKLLQEHPGRVHFHCGPQRLQPEVLCAAQPLGTHLYVCGPQPLIDAVIAAARAEGWPDSHIHWERFSAPPEGKPFTVVLAKTGIEIGVAADQTVLEALEHAGLEPRCLCRGGACGQCETAVLEGEVEHHDHYLSAADRAAHRKMMICVSRARSERLVLDI